MRCLDVFLQAAGPGLDLHRLTPTGRTALDIAVSHGSKLCAESLRNAVSQSEQSLPDVLASHVSGPWPPDSRLFTCIITFFAYVMQDKAQGADAWPRLSMMRASSAPTQLPESVSIAGQISISGYKGLSREQVAAIVSAEGRPGLMRPGSSKTLSALAASKKADQSLPRSSTSFGGGSLERRRIVESALAQLELTTGEKQVFCASGIMHYRTSLNVRCRLMQEKG